MSEAPKSLVSNYIDRDRLQRDVTFSENELDNAMTEQAGFAAYYGACAARASQQVGLMKVRLQTIEAKVYKEVRDLAARNNDKVTEAQLRMAVVADPRIVQAEAALVKAQYQADLGKVAFESFKQRRDMLVQISKTRLEDRKGELRAVENAKSATKNLAVNQ